MTHFPQVLAEYDDDGIYIYQAFKDNIVDAALKKGTFGEGFSLDRMTWIKPSFGWMLYRSGYATKKRQTRIVKVKMTHEGFQEILSGTRCLGGHQAQAQVATGGRASGVSRLG